MKELKDINNRNIQNFGEKVNKYKQIKYGKYKYIIITSILDFIQAYY